MKRDGKRLHFISVCLFYSMLYFSSQKIVLIFVFAHIIYTRLGEIEYNSIRINLHCLKVNPTTNDQTKQI